MDERTFKRGDRVYFVTEHAVAGYTWKDGLFHEVLPDRGRGLGSYCVVQTLDFPAPTPVLTERVSRSLTATIEAAMIMTRLDVLMLQGVLAFLQKDLVAAHIAQIVAKGGGHVAQ